MHERQRKAHSSRRIHQGRREHMSDIVQAAAGLLSHQQPATTPSGTRR
ncbi:hypothetical protein [Streptomyces sp. NPDC058045]